jgi:outer membrane protein insertion porin family
VSQNQRRSKKRHAGRTSARQGESRRRRTAPFLTAALVFASPTLFATPLAGQSQTVVVDTILVEGNVRLTDAVVQSTFGVQFGDEISYRDIQAAEKNLWSTGHFADIQVFARGIQGQPVDLILRVREQPIIRRLGIDGFDNISLEDVRDTTGILPGAAYSPVAS